ncbi:hypothetical protein D3C78_1380880 [compost metagenome]
MRIFFHKRWIEQNIHLQSIQHPYVGLRHKLRLRHSALQQYLHHCLHIFFHKKRHIRHKLWVIVRCAEKELRVSLTLIIIVKMMFSDD